jgi:hypothetical protein
MLHLIYVNVLIILMDITLLCTEYANLYEIQITFKGTLYSIKLRLEFAVLNSLMSLTHSNNSDKSRDAQYTHSATRNVGLETFNSNPRTDAQNDEAFPASYSVFATGSHNSPFTGEDNVVMKTTEVAVRTEVVETEGEEEEEGENHESNSPKVHRHRPNPSPASSEVEFAHDGF